MEVVYTELYRCLIHCHLPAAGQFDLGQAPTTKEAGAIADALYSEFVGEEVDKVELVYTKFVSLISSDPIIQTLLPLTPQVGDLSQVLQPKREQLMNSFSCVSSSNSLPQRCSRSAAIIQSLLQLSTKVGHVFWHRHSCTKCRRQAVAPILPFRCCGGPHTAWWTQLPVGKH